MLYVASGLHHVESVERGAARACLGRLGVVSRRSARRTRRGRRARRWSSRSLSCPIASIVSDDAPVVVQVAGDVAEHGDVDLGVLVLAEVVLQRLQPPHERLASALRQQAGEALEQVAQLLGVLAEVVDLLGGRVGTDQPAVIDQVGLGPGDALANHLPERPLGMYSLNSSASIGLAQPRRATSPSKRWPLVSAAPRSTLRAPPSRRRSSSSRTGSRATPTSGPSGRGVTVPLDEVDVEIARRTGESAEPREPFTGLHHDRRAAARSCPGETTERVRRTATRRS